MRIDSSACPPQVGELCEIDGWERGHGRSDVAENLLCLHNVSMPNVLVRDVPENVHARLQARADERGQSLQQYLAGELRRLAERSSMEEVLDRIATRRGGHVGLGQAVTDLAADRDRA